jgi:tRNA dimethylallyltransferase
VRAALEREETEALAAELLAADSAAGTTVDLSNRRRVLRSVETLRLTGMTPSEWAASAEQARYRAYDAELAFTGFVLDRDDPAPAVAARLEAMRAAGFWEEVQRLAARLGRTASHAVGYRQLLDVVAGRRSLDEGFQAAERATMALVKRQRTFFRPDPRLQWVDADQPDLPDTVMREASL